MTDSKCPVPRPLNPTLDADKELFLKLVKYGKDAVMNLYKEVEPYFGYGSKEIILDKCKFRFECKEYEDR